MYLEEAAGRHVYFAKCNFMSKIIDKLMQLVIGQVSKLYLKTTQCSSTWGSSSGGVCSSPSPFEGYKHSVTVVK